MEDRLEKFIKKANIIHNNYYDYSKVTYINNKTKVVIICPIHGEFLQKPNYHISDKNGCPKCSTDKSRTFQLDFIKKANSIHKNFFDYSKLPNSFTSRSMVTIICPIHGEFLQKAGSHINYNSNGCIKCKGKSRSNTREFVTKSINVHGNYYDYSKVTYINNKTKVVIICPIHGEFLQKPVAHIRGNGCILCANSTSTLEETIINFLKESNIKYSHRDRTVLHGKEIDIYLPDHKLGIECHGNYWHSELLPLNKHRYHGWVKTHLRDKYLSSLEAGIILLQFYEDEILYNLDFVKEKILMSIKANPPSSNIGDRFCLNNRFSNDILLFRKFFILKETNIPPSYSFIYKNSTYSARYDSSEIMNKVKQKLLFNGKDDSKPYQSKESLLWNAHNNGLFRIWDAGYTIIEITDHF